MTNIANIAAAGVHASALRYDPGAAKAGKATTSGTPSSVNPASVMVDMTMSQVTYTASLNTLRSANKTMMGYMLNIKV